MNECVSACHPDFESEMWIVETKDGKRIYAIAPAFKVDRGDHVETYSGIVGVAVSRYPLYNPDVLAAVSECNTVHRIAAVWTQKWSAADAR